MKCIFPFTLGGETFDVCTRQVSLASNGDPWCPTKVDDDGAYIIGQGNWGRCSQACPVEEGCKCVFPFKYNGITHNACTYESTMNSSWCSTKVDDQGQDIGYWATCSPECPFELANDPKSETPQNPTTQVTQNYLKELANDTKNDEIAKDGRCIV